MKYPRDTAIKGNLVDIKILGNVYQGQGPPHSTKDHKGRGPGGQGEEVQGGPLLP